MQLNVTTDYAIRVILYLSAKGGIVSSRELSEKNGIPEKYILKITKILANAGLITTHKGIRGGFSIMRPAQEISLLDVITTMENTIKINRCMEKDEYCSRCATDSCPVRGFYCELQDELENKLSHISIQDLLNEANRKEKRL